MLAGLSEPDAGTLNTAGECWLDRATRSSLAPQQREAVLVFQHYALFPHLSVRNNVGYAAKDAAFVDELLELFALRGIESHKPGSLSGGQQQRTALARALAARPKFLLLDEPLAAQDAALRKELCDTLLALQKRQGFSLFLVSHTIEEIATLTEWTLVFQEDCTTSMRKTQDFSEELIRTRYCGTVLHHP